MTDHIVSLSQNAGGITDNVGDRCHHL